MIVGEKVKEVLELLLQEKLITVTDILWLGFIYAKKGRKSFFGKLLEFAEKNDNVDAETICDHIKMRLKGLT